MIDEFFSGLRSLANLVEAADVKLKERENIDVYGPQHHNLQQTAISRLRSDVTSTKTTMKTLQPTVVGIQKFGRINDISAQIISIQEQRLESLKAHLKSMGYEGPPAKQLKPSCEDQPQEALKKDVEYSGSDYGNDRACQVMDETGDPDGHPPHPPAPSQARQDHLVPKNGLARAQQDNCMPISPVAPILQSSNELIHGGYAGGGGASSCDVGSRYASAAGVGIVDTGVGNGDNLDVAMDQNGIISNSLDETDDDSVLATVLPPTPVITARQDVETGGCSDPSTSSLSLSTLQPPMPYTPVRADITIETPTPPSLLSAAKKNLDITKINFSDLEDGEVFHTGLTPKTPELQSNYFVSSKSTAKKGSLFDTPFDGRAHPSSPNSQQSFAALKRELQFGGSGFARSGMVLQPISFVEFEQKKQKLSDITRDMLNSAIKSLNAVFREKELTSFAMELEQSEVVSLLDSATGGRLGTKIILMLLKFRRIDCRSVNGLSYVSPATDADDSALDMTNNDD